MSKREEFEREKALFHRACEVPDEQRVAFLDDACRGNSSLRERLDVLLAAEDEPILDAAEGFPDASTPTIRGYTLLRKIGDGGMGEVWEAEQEGPIRRRVALKLIRWGMDTDSVVRRFESERQALALMDHPGIARVFAAGSSDQGRPYFAMELVEGIPITEYCDRHQLSVVARLDLIVRVCGAVQHAHQKGIIHRDLKPANILVTDDESGAVPKIIDFGVAKAVDHRAAERAVFTEIGQWIGTPEYMSPEQAAISGDDVDTRTDVYSLGVVLYEVLVGSQPLSQDELRAVGFDEMRRQIQEREPPRPSARARTTGAEGSPVPSHRLTSVRGLVRALEGDLDWLTMKALEKDRDRRYSSPSEFAADIERHLRHEPVLAGPPGGLCRVRKFVRRHRVGVMAAAFCVVALIVGLTLATIGFVSARESEREAVAQAESAREVSAFLEEVFRVMDPGSHAGRLLSTRDMLQHGSDRIAESLLGQPLVRARLMATMGGVSTSLGYYDLAEPLLTEALELQRQNLGDHHPDVARTLFSSGWLAFWQADHEAALDAFDETVSILETTQGSVDNRLALSARSRRGLARLMTGDLGGARNDLERSLAEAEAAFGPKDPLISDPLLYSGHLHFELGEYEQAAQDYRRAAAIREVHFGADHPQHSVVSVGLARVHRMLGDLDEAESVMRRAIDTLEVSYGSDHPLLADALGSQGTTLRAQGDLDGAIRHYERALEILELQFGSDYPRSSWLLRGLASTHLRLGEIEDAVGVAREALRIAGCSPGESRIDCARTHSIIGRAEYELGHHQEALEAYQASREIFFEILGPTHPTVMMTHYSTACCAALAGDQTRAIEALQDALDAGFSSPLIATDTDLASLRHHPEFEEMVREVKRRRPR